MTAHSVNTEGLQRLQALMGASRKSPLSQKGEENDQLCLPQMGRSEFEEEKFDFSNVFSEGADVNG